MKRAPAYTLVDLAVTLVVVTVILLLMFPAFANRARETSARTICAANLSGIYKAMYSYGVVNDDTFPTAGASTVDGRAIGFREGDRRTGRGAVLENNVTASLWMMVRDGSVSVKQFVCYSTKDAADPLTVSLTDPGPALLANTHDFLERRNLSYSPMNPYHTTLGRYWSTNAPSDYVLLADNNANDHPRRHTSSTRPAAETENSPNHGYEGQNMVFGDGHVDFATDPYQGPKGDNVYAMIESGIDAPPILSNSAGDAATDPAVAARDVVLLPLSGNGGVSLSGNPLDVTHVPDPGAARRRQRWILTLVAVGFIITLIGAITLLRKRQVHK